MYCSVKRASLCAVVGLCLSADSFSQVVEVSDFSDTGRSVHRSKITEYEGALYFGVGVDDTDQRELWNFDGTRVNLISDGFFGGTETAIDDFTVFQGDLYFSADAGSHGRELYRYDGNQITLAADLSVGPTSSNPVGLFVHNDNLYFSAKIGESFNNLWKYDGTTATRIAQFADPRASVVTGATFQGDLFFGADDGVTGMELWKYDGAQFSRIADLNPGGSDSYPRDFTVVGDTLYFKATTEQYGQEIWRYDGTTVSILEDVNPGPMSSDPRYMTEVDGDLLFSAVTDGNRYVHRFDGTRTRAIVQGGGPLELGDTLVTLRGNSSSGVEIQEFHTIDEAGGEATLLRSLVHSAGPFSPLDGELYFSCACEPRELYKVAAPGDADSDGQVAFSDFLTLSENYGRPGSWLNGDFNADGMIGFGDLLLQARNFGPDSKAFAQAVPEPQPAAFLGILMLGWLSGRRSRRRLC